MAPEQSLQNVKPLNFEPKALLAVAIVFCLAGPAFSEVRTITATGEYRMGDNDTRTDAKRLALLDAKRLALEQAGVYIESITEVKNLDLANEEIRAYTAGIVEVVEQATRTTMEGEATIVRVDVTTKIDTGVVARQIDSLRKNEDVKTKLLRAESDALKLRKELDAKTHELTAAKSRAAAEAVTKQRQKMLTQADVESLVARARVALAGSKGFTVTVGTSTPESRKYARGLIERALSYEPENTEAQGLLGFVQFEEGQREEAISTFRGIAKKEPLSAHAHMNLGKVLQASRDWFAAVKEYETARKLEPDLAEAHAALGQALPIAAWLLEGKENATSEERQKLRNARQKLMERAVEALREAARLAPRNATYHRALGDALYSLAASRDFTQLGIEEEEVKRILLARERDQEEGLAELRRAVELDPADAAAHKALAERIGGEEAIAEYRTAARLDPNDLDTRLDLGTLLLNEKDAKGARDQFEAAVRINPKSVKAHQRLGRAFEDLGQIDRTIDEYRTAVSLLGADSENWMAPAYVVYLLSEALSKVGKPREATQVIRDYLKSNPEDKRFEDSLLQRLQELERA